MAKLHVVGGGPAGSIAAMSALRSGHEVVVSEEHHASGLPKNCSGLISTEGLRSLSSFMDWRKQAVAPMRGAVIRIPGHSFTVRRKEPVAYVCDRAAMDQELAWKAEEEGARFIYGDRVDGRFRSRNVIGADGPLSSVALHFGFPRVRRFASTLQASVPYRNEGPDMVELFISNSMFPGFFGWVIPHDERTAEFGVGVEMPGDVLSAWKALLRLKKADSKEKPSGAVIPMETRGRTAMARNGWKVLLAGDAAGQVKATTGGGVVFGGNCAALAGRFADSPSRYEIEWRARFGLDLALHGMIHRFFAGATDSSLSALGKTFKKLDMDVYLSDHGHMDRPTRMLRPQLLAHVFRNLIG